MTKNTSKMPLFERTVDTIVTDNSAVIAALNERVAELEKQIDFKIKECQELASSCNRWKLQALKAGK